MKCVLFVDVRPGWEPGILTGCANPTIRDIDSRRARVEFELPDEWFDDADASVGAEVEEVTG